MIGILKSMGVAMKNVFRREITFQYPLEKRKLPPRFRGALAIRGSLDEKFEREITPEIPPCQAACPAGVAAREQNILIAEGKLTEAFKLVQESNILPGVLGGICHHPCENECTRGLYDQSISIRALHRVASEGYFQEGKSLKVLPKQRGDKVAIIGAGPSGLAAAYDLNKQGYSVTIFEKETNPGGMLFHGIPKYRLSSDVLQREIEDVLSLGIELKSGVEIGKDLSLNDLKEQGYNAVLIAVGLQLSRGLPLEGADLDGVLLAIPFLKAANNKQKLRLGGKVIVIGGGNIAIDVARCARRLGFQVDLVCLESRKEMPSYPWEIAEAVEEGIGIHPSKGPRRFLGKNGKFTGVEFMECLSVFDAQGRFSPTFDEKKLYTLEADSVIIAIGQASELSFLKDTGIKLNERGQLIFDPVTLETSVPGIFASGEVVTGPGSCIGSIASGHHAAISIDRYLKGQNLKQGRVPFQIKRVIPFDWEGRIKEEKLEEVVLNHYKTPLKSVSESSGYILPLLPISRRKIPKIEPEVRVKNFTPVELSLGEKNAYLEAWRCLRCENGKCVACSICAQVCPTEAISQYIVQNGGRKIPEFNVDLRKCVFCGICVENCPTKTLFHTLEYELSVADGEKLVYNKERLLREVPKEFLPSGEEIPVDEITAKIYRWYR